MKKLLMGVVLVIVALCATNVWAAVSQTVAVSATVPTVSGGLSVTVSKVVGGVFSSASSINFGTLVLDSVNNIYTTSDKSYYAVDIGVTDTTAWTLTHTRSSLISGGNNLDSNVNVTFVKQTATTGTELSKFSFDLSNAKAFTKTELAGGWLRIYYGLGTGSTGDATGVTAIGLDKPAGTYTGAVIITLTP